MLPLKELWYLLKDDKRKEEHTNVFRATYPAHARRFDPPNNIKIDFQDEFPFKELHFPIYFSCSGCE